MQGTVLKGVREYLEWPSGCARADPAAPRSGTNMIVLIERRVLPELEKEKLTIKYDLKSI